MSGDMVLGLLVLLSCKPLFVHVIQEEKLMVVSLVEVSVVLSLVSHSDNKIEHLVISQDFGPQSQLRWSSVSPPRC